MPRDPVTMSLPVAGAERECHELAVPRLSLAPLATIAAVVLALVLAAVA